MFKIISNLFIIVTIGLLVITVAKPELANNITEQVLGTLSKAPQIGEALIPSEKKVEPLTSTFFKSIKIFPKSESNSEAPEINTSDLTIDNILVSTNIQRATEGLPALKLNTKLVQSSTLKTNDMIAKQYFEHESPTGKSVSDLGTEVGYNYIIMGENLALGNFKTADDLLLAWMNSPGHRANIMSTMYQEIGVYASKGDYQGREVWFAVQHFGTMRTACPQIDANLKKSIDSINSDLKKREATIATQKAYLESPERPRGEEYKTAVTVFNELVSEYNLALVVSQEKIKQYNTQVASFNKCLSQYQTKV